MLALHNSDHAQLLDNEAKTGQWVIASYDLNSNPIPTLRKKYPGLEWRFVPKDKLTQYRVEGKVLVAFPKDSRGEDSEHFVVALDLQK